MKEILIKIHEKDYQSVLNGHIPFSVLDAVKDGTPLPKGHGKLIDADELRKTPGAIYHCILAKAPTIIEADKESEQCNSTVEKSED